MKSFLTIALFVILLKLDTKSQIQLLPQDSSWLNRFHTETATSVNQKQTLDSIYVHYTLKIYQIDSEIKLVQQSDLTEDSLNTKVSNLNDQRKSLKELRELDLTSHLNELQRKIYYEKIKPAKPAVLHFGMNHDRANCNVCK